MKLRQIEIFNAVYTIGSVSGAAKFLNITQPTASKILKYAEDQIGFKLFRRVKGRLIPTQEADILFGQTKLITDQVTSLQKTARNLLDADKGCIRLSSISALGLEHIPRAILRFQDTHPDVRFEFQTRHSDNLVFGIKQKEKDVGIMFNAPQQKGIDTIDLGFGEFVCIYTGDLFDGSDAPIKTKDLTKKPFISIANSGPLGDLLNRSLLESGLKLKTRITAQTYFSALNLVAMGGGIAIVDEFTANSSGVGDVKIKSFAPPIRFKIQAVHRDNNPPSKLMRRFLALFKTEILSNR